MPHSLQIDKEMWYVIPVAYYSAGKKIKTMNLADKWMDLEKVILNEGNPDPDRQTSRVLSHLRLLAPNPQVYNSE